MAINLLPWRETIYWKKRSIFSRLLLFSLIGAVFILWLILAVISERKNKLLSDQQILSKQIQFFQKKNKEQGQFIGDQKRQKQIKLITNVFEKEDEMSVFLENLGNMELKGIYLTQLFFEKKQLNVKGVAISILNIFQFATKLREFPMVKAVQFAGAELLNEPIDSSARNHEWMKFDLEINMTLQNNLKTLTSLRGQRGNPNLRC